ncbi:MAG: hypothetical protein ACQXXJ_07150 [Candidatus Bathyarchaeia archaeon]|jgi:hypothetical protein
MSEKPPSKDEALEALDFIVNVLKEHEKDLDHLISELGTVAGNLGDSGELSEKVAKVEDKITGLQTQVTTLLKQLTPSQLNPSLNQTQPTTALTAGGEKAPAPQVGTQNSVTFVLHCSQWVDFQARATQAQTVSFTYNETEKTFQATALKNNQLLIYKGEIPCVSGLLKTWLSRQLATPERMIWEGTLAIS